MFSTIESHSTIIRMIGPHEVPTSDADFADRVYNSRLRRDNTVLGSDSQYMQVVGFIGYSVAFLDFRVPSYGSTSDFRLGTEQSSMSMTRDSPLKSEIEP